MPQSLAQAVIAESRTQYGFLTDHNVAILARDPETRLTRVLVRCGGCRFIAGAQDVLHLVSIIETEGRDYVRDLSLQET